MTVGALPITMAPAAGGKSVATEFGWATPFSCATKTPRGGVATSGFNLSTFVGKSGAPTIVPSLTAWSCRGDGVSGNSTQGIFYVNGDGTLSGGAIGGTVTSGSANWATPTTAGTGNSYYVKFTVTGGTSTTNTASAWTLIGAGSKQISKTGTVGSGTCTFTVQIATDAAGTNIVSSGTGFVVGYDHTA